MQISKTSGMPNTGARQKTNSSPVAAEAPAAAKPVPSESFSLSDSQGSEKSKSVIEKMFGSTAGRIATGVTVGATTGLLTGVSGGNPTVAKAVSATVGGAVGTVAGAGLGFIVSLPFALMNNSSKPMSIGAGVGAVGGGALGVAGGLARGEMIAAFGNYLGGGVVGHTAAGALVGGGAALLTLI